LDRKPKRSAARCAKTAWNSWAFAVDAGRARADRRKIGIQVERKRTVLLCGLEKSRNIFSFSSQAARVGRYPVFMHGRREDKQWTGVGLLAGSSGDKSDLNLLKVNK
jgi:hypothetical protein